MNLVEPTYRTIKVTPLRGAIEIQLNRPEVQNSINDTLLKEISEVILSVEADSNVKVIILSGDGKNFCTGMDFKEVATNAGQGVFKDDPNGYYNLLKLFSTSSKLIIAKVAGKVNAGGIGLVAASDIVIADKNAVFSLSEMLFGLIPACVMPFLIKRIGVQKAQWLALITQPIDAERAYQIGLLDELSDDLNNSVRKNLIRLTKLESASVKTLKNYMNKLWIIDGSTQKLAVDEITSLMDSPKVQENIRNFVINNKFPWDK